MSYYLTIADVEKSIVQGSMNRSAPTNGRHSFGCSVLSEDGSYRPALDAQVIFVEGSATSGTSLTTGLGAKTFTTQSGLHWVAGERFRAWGEGSAYHDRWMEGTVTSYIGTTLVVNVDTVHGAAITLNNWTIGRRVFGGKILTPTESGATDYGTAIVTRINAEDFGAFVTRRMVNLTIPAGTLKAALIALSAYFNTGITLDPNQATGATLPELNLLLVSLESALQQLSQLTGWPYEVDYYGIVRMFDPASRTAPFDILQGDGHVSGGDFEVEPTRIGYVNNVILVYNDGQSTVTAKDDAEIAAHDQWDALLTAKDTTDPAAAQDVANAYLAEHLPVRKQAKYPTTLGGLHPGQTQNVNVSWRNVNNSFIVTEVDTGIDPDNQDGLLHQVTALEGDAYQAARDWRNVFKQWGTPNQQSISGAFGGPGLQRIPVYPLGGSWSEFVQSDDPDWIAVTGEVAGAGGVQVSVSTVAAPGRAATVHLRMRAMAGEVIARLQNLTDGTEAGRSTAVASTAWTTRTFDVTLAPGLKVYELQLLPSLANTDVAASGAYLE
jgi:hypothetical protein